MFKLIQKNSKKYLISLGLISFLFLWDLKFDLFQARFLIFIIIFPLISEVIIDIKNKKTKYLIYFLYLSIFIFFHLILNIYIDNKNIDPSLILSFILLIYIILITIYFYKDFTNNIDWIIKIFLIIFIISCLFGIIMRLPDAPHFCGGIPDIFNFFTHVEFNADRLNSSYYKVSFSEFLFLENSHLGMIAPGVLCYMTYIMFSKKKDLLFQILTILFFIICLVKSSTTFLIGSAVSIFLLCIFNSKKLEFKTNILFFIIILLLSGIFIFSDECKYRLPLNNFENNKLILKSDNTQSKTNTKESMDQQDNFIKNLQLKLDFNTTLSTSIYFNNLRISIISLKEKPLGWGLNRYYDASTYFNNKYPPDSKRVNGINELKEYNLNDGSNNLFKLITEFGVFSFIFFFYIFKYIVNNKIPMSNKLFFVPIILTQLIRGAGYFNGGFVLIICIIIFQLINIKK